jgi:hypothetical protein
MPDLYFLALSRMDKLKSAFLWGVGEDAEFLAQYIERRSRVSGTFATSRAHPEAELDPRWQKQ